MATDDSANRTELEDFLAILTQPDEEGQPFIVAGGHAVNYWAKLYLPREPRLQAYLPFTSKDLDVIGSESSARRVTKALGWQYSPAVAGGGLCKASSNLPRAAIP